MRSRLLKYKRKERKKCADGNGPIDQNDGRSAKNHAAQNPNGINIITDYFR